MCFCEGNSPEPELLVSNAEWADIEFEVALDSGGIDHVCYSGDVPGHVTEASPGIKAGQASVCWKWCPSSQ